MTHFRPVTHLDTFALVASLHGRRSLFDAITLRQDTPGSPHKDTRSIFLRGPDDPNATTWFQDVPHKDYGWLESWPEAQDVLDHIAVALKVPGMVFGKVMVIELKAGGALGWHRDEGPYSERHVRYHLPLVSNPGAILYSGPEQAHLPVGLLTHFDNRSLHSAANHGAHARIHLVADVRR